MALRPKNWKTFQHYKDRRPPWIRLYHHLLDQSAWWSLKGDDAKQLINLWLIASESEDGELPSIADTAFRLRMTEVKCVQMLGRLQAWIEDDASNALAECKQVATPEERRVDTEADTEGEESAPPAKVPVLKPEPKHDFNADPEENMPDGLAITQYAGFLMQELHIPAGSALTTKTGDAIGLLAKEEACSRPEATRRMLDRMRTAQAAGPVKWLFWLEDGGWKQRAAFSIGIEDEQ